MKWSHEREVADKGGYDSVHVTWESRADRGTALTIYQKELLNSS